MDVCIEKSSPLRGEITVPGDKSISHRAVMLGSLSEGVTEITGFLPGEDCLSTISCFRAMGVDILREGTAVRIEGRGLHGLREPAAVLDVGNSGTTARLMTGVLSAQDFFAVVSGDTSLNSRPMARIIKPLSEMGADITGRCGNSKAPLAVRGRKLSSCRLEGEKASAQVKSAVLLAGLYTDSGVEYCEPHRSRNHTELMLKAFGADVTEEISEGRNRVVLVPPGNMTGRAVKVPGDISSAAFFMTAALIVPGSRLIINDMGINPTRSGIIDVFSAMGAEIEISGEREQNMEPVADVTVSFSCLKGTDIGGALIPRLIDELPVIAVAAAFAEGETVVSDAGELRVKESNRISAVVEMLLGLGADIRETEDGFVINGSCGKQLAGGITFNPAGDHRMAMSAAVAALNCFAPVTVEDAGCADVSFPGFFEMLKNTGRE